MNNYFDEENLAKKQAELTKIQLLEREQKIGGLTYAIAVFASLFANFIFTIAVSAIASKLFPQYPLEDSTTNGVTELGAISMLRQYQLYRYASFLIVPLFLSFVIVGMVLIYQRKANNLGFTKAKPLYFILSLPVVLGLFFGLSWINSLFLKAINYQPADVLPNLNGGYFFLAMLVIAILPAVVEEIVFRGLILNGLKANGTLFACLVSGALFSLFHMNPEQTIYQFICGVIFAYIALKAGSILPTMLIHFLNNFIALFNAKFNFWGENNSIIATNSPWHIVIVVTACLLLVATIGFFVYQELKGIKKRGKTGIQWARRVQVAENAKESAQETPNKWRFFLFAGAGVLGAVGMWLALLFANLL